MSRPRRLSRGLIGLLIITIVLGLLFYFNNVRKTRASETAAPPTVQPLQPAPKPVLQVTTTPPPRATPVLPATQPSARPAVKTVAMTSEPAPAGNPLVSARARKDAGDLLAARKILNDALVSGRVAAGDIVPIKQMLGEINQTAVFSPKALAGDEFGASYTVKSGELLRTIAERNEITWELLARINGISDPRKLRAGQVIKVVNGPFHAIVSKSRYTMDIYLGSAGEKGSMFVASYPVGLGANDSTPLGTWLVEPHKKLKNPTYFSPRGEGVVDADDPANPLGERWIGLVGIDGGAVGQSSYGIHGTIEPETIGKQASMGCIRMHNEDVLVVFDLLVEGKSTVVVKE